MGTYPDSAPNFALYILNYLHRSMNYKHRRHSFYNAMLIANLSGFIYKLEHDNVRADIKSRSIDLLYTPKPIPIISARWLSALLTPSILIEKSSSSTCWQNYLLYDRSIDLGVLKPVLWFFL